MFFSVDEGVDIIGCQLEVMAVRDCVGRAGFYAIPAENASGIVNVVDAGVALACGNSGVGGIFRGLDVDTICGTSGGAEETSHAFFQTLFVAMQHVDSTVARLEVNGFLGIIFGNGFAKHVREGYSETFCERHERVAKFS